MLEVIIENKHINEDTFEDAFNDVAKILAESFLEYLKQEKEKGNEKNSN